jgi:2-keto-3-deoxy-L-rhamnonate aldolase RhmA
VEKALLEILEKAKKQRVATGIFCMNAAAVEKWFGLGVDFVLYGIDSMFIRETAYGAAQSLRRFT